MKHNEIGDAPFESPRSGIRSNVVDAVVAAVLLLVGIVVIVESRRLGSGWTSDGPGAGYFPFYIGLIIVISSLGILYQALLSRNKDTKVFVDAEQLRRVLSVLIPAALYWVSRPRRSFLLSPTHDKCGAAGMRTSLSSCNTVLIVRSRVEPPAP